MPNLLLSAAVKINASIVDRARSLIGGSTTNVNKRSLVPCSGKKPDSYSSISIKKFMKNLHSILSQQHKEEGLMCQHMDWEL
jgi:hypothetical protein